MARTRSRLVVCLAISIVASLLVIVPSPPARSAPTELFISEYVEGSSNDKAIEIYNGTGTAVDLAGYTLEMFFNGSTAAGLTIALTGAVADGDVHVVAHASASFAAEADQTNGSGWFNGDDAVVLRKGGAVVDSLGQIGFDPGAEWGSGLASTQDNTLRRKAGIEAGDTIPDDPFAPAAEWDGFAEGTFDGLGFYGSPPSDPGILVINEIDYDQVGTDATEYVEITNVGAGAADLSRYSLNFVNGSTASIYKSITLTGTLSPGDHYVVCANATTVANCDLDDAPDTNFIQNGAPDAVALFESGVLVDAVSYEGDTAAPYTEGSGEGLVDDPDLTDFGISRCDDGVDTNQNNVDLVAAAATPGGANACAPPEIPVVINEFSANTTGTDVEYVEVFGPASTDLSGLTILEVEGDGTNTGTVDGVIGVGSTDADGFWLASLAANELENGTITLLLVSNFTGDVGDDLDTGNDGTLDTAPWDEIVDSVAVFDGDSGDAVYASTVLADNYDGLAFPPGGASRIPDGTDTDTTDDWVRNDFDLAGIPGFSGTPTPGEALNTPGATNQAVEAPPPPPLGACGDPATLIHAVQGAGLASPLAGSTVVIEGIVVGDFQNNGQPDDGELNGFHVQEEDADTDGDPGTSDGIFVFGSSAAEVEVGDQVRVLGAVSEFFDLTEITTDEMRICSEGNPAPTPGMVTLPVDSLDDFEAFEGMGVVLPQDLSISEFFNFDRFGEIVLTNGRLMQPTAVAEPGSAEAAAVADLNRRSRITLDDGRGTQNPDPAIHPNGSEFTLDNLFRGGDLVTNATGVMDFSFGLYRVQPTEGAQFTPTNPRPAEHEAVGGNLEVASFNVLNYFTTLTSEGNVCGPAQDQECRGADNPEEFERQRDKIITAVTEMDSDVVGLIEIENNPSDVPTADLVNGLNDELGAGTYDYIATGAIGTDAIRQALIYKPGSVAPVGDFAILDSSVDPRFDDDRNRPVLAQTFIDLETGGVFTVAVNHLKSKGSDCGGPPDDDPEQGNCNGTRTRAAEAMVDWLATDPTGSGDDDVLIIGDLNAYDKEDPIDVLVGGGYIDLIRKYQGEEEYSFLFDGQLGYLDHGLANPALVDEVTGATVWHINADEADLIDYDTSFKEDAQDAIYAPDAYRSSDHDPVIVGLAACDEIVPEISVDLSKEVLWPPDHMYQIVEATVTATDNFDPNPTVELVSVTSDEPDDGSDDGNTVTDIVVVDDDTFELRAERSGDGDGRTYTITYRVTDDCGNSTLGSATVVVPLSMES